MKLRLENVSENRSDLWGRSSFTI